MRLLPASAAGRWAEGLWFHYDYENVPLTVLWGAAATAAARETMLRTLEKNILCMAAARRVSTREATGRMM